MYIPYFAYHGELHLTLKNKIINRWNPNENYRSDRSICNIRTGNQSSLNPDLLNKEIDLYK